jgi:hypothetical protein
MVGGRQAGMRRARAKLVPAVGCLHGPISSIYYEVVYNNLNRTSLGWAYLHP